ncbi:hypothetical protein [Zobellia sp. B3R18]|uniref:hypothetical protein n=1 Tax=Zobellia sp. B3R18 TaxID=2841568 RepID=UPI001C077A5A|nr:hypothetical protein [Zobellia sp. B3R18]MBU2972947.1 hypothetical protein [Zobellia sp. B3R18]
MKKLVFGLLACASLLAVSCESSDVASDDSVYEEGVDKTQLINGDSRKKSVDKTQLINGDSRRRSVDKTQLINGDSRR